MIAYTIYPTDGRVRLEAETLVKRGYDVVFLVLKGDRRPRTYQLCGVTVIELNVAKYRGKSKLRYLFSYLHFLLLATAACTLQFLRSHIRVVHVHNMPDLLVFAALVPRIFGCRVVLDIHDSVPETYAGKFTKPSGALFRLLAFEERICCAFAHRIICVNHPQKETVVGRGVPAGKVHTVITMPVFARPANRDIPPKEERPFRLVNHGTVSQRLGIDLLVQAAAVLAGRIPEFELHIIGGGDDLQQVVDLAEKLGISKRVHFHKGVPWDTLPEKLRGMDVGIIANRISIATELMLPSKLIDYVSLDIPVVVPRLRAIEYYFTPEMVTFFEPEKVDSMIDAVLQLYGNPERRRSQATAARSFTETYAWEKRQDLHDLYRGLLQEDIKVRQSSAEREVL